MMPCHHSPHRSDRLLLPPAGTPLATSLLHSTCCHSHRSYCCRVHGRKFYAKSETACVAFHCVCFVTTCQLTCRVQLGGTFSASASLCRPRSNLCLLWTECRLASRSAPLLPARRGSSTSRSTGHTPQTYANSVKRRTPTRATRSSNARRERVVCRPRSRSSRTRKPSRSTDGTDVSTRNGMTHHRPRNQAKHEHHACPSSFLRALPDAAHFRSSIGHFPSWSHRATTTNGTTDSSSSLA